MLAISKSVGEGGANLPHDCAVVDDALRKAGLLAQVSPSAAVRNDAIRRLQRAWGSASPDGKVDPGGATLKHLDETITPLRLNPITVAKITKGGWDVSFTPKTPGAPYQLFFGCSMAPGDYIEVTGCKSGDVLTASNLPAFLNILARRNAWGGEVGVQLVLMLGTTRISTSNMQSLKTPVHPHNGRLLPLDEAGNGPRLTYQGDAKTDQFWGRMLHKFDGVDGWFFKYGGVLETDPAKRGFDCITYAGTVCGAPTTSMGDSPSLASALAAAQCTCQKVVASAQPPALPKTMPVVLEKAAPDDVREFFTGNQSGYYMMWSGGHVVLVANGQVHEFAASKGGYASQPVGDWLKPYTQSKLTVRKLAGKPAMAT